MKKQKSVKPRTSVPKQVAASGSTSTNPLVAHNSDTSLIDLLKDQPIHVNSIGAALLGLDRGSVLRELQLARTEMVRFYMKPEGGNHSAEDALKLVDDFPDDPETALRNVINKPVTSVSWYGLKKLYNQAPDLVKQIWRLICDEAHQELRSGHRMASNFQATDWQRTPWIRAQFLAIRTGFIEEWKPKGGIELALIDMMAQAYSEYQYWVAETHRRSTTDAKVLSLREEELYKRAEGHWIPPRVTEQAAIEHAMQMMDRYNRLFLRTLRQLRDLRRYSTPVTINNPAQVNIAADGGQQINAVATKDPTTN